MRQDVQNLKQIVGIRYVIHKMSEAQKCLSVLSVRLWLLLYVTRFQGIWDRLRDPGSRLYQKRIGTFLTWGRRLHCGEGLLLFERCQCASVEIRERERYRLSLRAQIALSVRRACRLMCRTMDFS